MLTSGKILENTSKVATYKEKEEILIKIIIVGNNYKICNNLYKEAVLLENHVYYKGT